MGITYLFLVNFRSILSLAVVSLFLSVKLTEAIDPTLLRARAKVDLIPANNTGLDPVSGSLLLKQRSTGVFIYGRIRGLLPGKHGFHVHAVGDLGNDCKNAGGHFNPQMVMFMLPASIWKHQ